MRVLTSAVVLAGVLYASSAWAQVATIPVMSERNNEPHDYSFGPIVVPGGVNFARFIPSGRDVLRNDGTLTVVLELSLNNGISYESVGGDVFNAALQPTEFFVQLAEQALFVGGTKIHCSNYRRQTGHAPAQRPRRSQR